MNYPPHCLSAGDQQNLDTAHLRSTISQCSVLHTRGHILGWLLGFRRLHNSRFLAPLPQSRAREVHNYTDRFYRPYRNYPGKILAIPGNHDGEVKSPLDRPSLAAFREAFCAPAAVVPEQASVIGVFRQTMTQPGVYWLLDALFVRIIGLHSNLLESPGYLEGKTDLGQPDISQLEWLRKTLKAAAANPEKKGPGHRDAPPAV